MTRGSDELLTQVRTTDIRTAGILFFLAGLVMLLAITVGEAVYPAYSVHAQAISDLLAIGTQTSIFLEPAGFAWGLSWILGSYFLLRNIASRKLLVWNLLPGIGVLLAVLSPENVNVVIHSVGAVIAFIPGAVVVTFSYRLVRSPIRYFTLLLGILSLFATIAEFGAYYSPLVQQTLGPGGWERIIVYPVLIWLVSFGSYLLALGRPLERWG